MATVTLTTTAAALAIGVGVALDRLVLPEIRSESTSASTPSGTAGRRSHDSPPTGRTHAEKTSGIPKAETSAPTGPAHRTTPPLKPLVGLPRASSSPSPSPSSDPSRRPGRPTPPPSGSAPETSVVLLTNAERTKAGCPALRADKRLTAAARAHSADMAANDYFDHTSRNGDSPWERMEDAGYPSPGAENIAKGYPDAAAVVAGWMKSPGHRANILNCRLKAIGVGMATGPGGPWWTQDFGWQ